MPIYDYHCDRCGHAFSAVRSYSDDSMPPCPKCGSVPRRLITTPAIVFKGSGWYKTDSRASSNAGKDTKDAKDTTSPGATPKDGVKEGSKPEAKAEATGGEAGKGTEKKAAAG